MILYSGLLLLCGIREVLHGSVHIIHRSYRGIVYRHRASFIPPLLLNMFDVYTPFLLVKFQEVPEHALRMSLERRALRQFEDGAARGNSYLLAALLHDKPEICLIKVAGVLCYPGLHGRVSGHGCPNRVTLAFCQ